MKLTGEIWQGGAWRLKHCRAFLLCPTYQARVAQTVSLRYNAMPREAGRLSLLEHYRGSKNPSKQGSAWRSYFPPEAEARNSIIGQTAIAH